MEFAYCDNLGICSPDRFSHVQISEYTEKGFAALEAREVSGNYKDKHL